MRLFIRYMISAAVLCLLHTSCENKLADDLINDGIYILESGENIVTTFKMNSKAEYTFTVYKSGLKGNATAVLEIDENALEEYNEQNSTTFKLLSKDLFSIDKEQISVGGQSEKEIIKVTFDVEKLRDILEVGDREYIVPLRLVAHSGATVVDEKSKILIIPELIGGVRPNSEKVLFDKSLAELGIDQTNEMTVSFAVTKDYLYMNTRGEDLRYYDRLTGEYKGTIELPFKSSLANFSMTSDKNNSVIISNLRRGAALAEQVIYKIDGTSSPTKLLSVSHTYANGRKLSVKGNLNKDALILSVCESLPQVLYWEVIEGNLISDMPKVYTLDSNIINWTLQADAYPVSLDINDGIYVVSSGSSANLSILGHFDILGNLTNTYDLISGGLSPSNLMFNHSIDMCLFNDVNYLALGTGQDMVAENDNLQTMHSRLLKVNTPSELSQDPLSKDILVYTSPIMLCEGNKQKTGDVMLIESEDKKYMTMYTMGTNGGVVAVQFDSEAYDQE